ncbi:hypothetical protein PSTG_03917 [Puccinia striiformis f. sp. tritici PST-78]|uniref:Uncharacterized protein n=1 Tax=Puccinia striiformis f. sp. tritici PST-78 TaxID=1165861 RepID=A0A0L0VUM7_9BASI|nr:hypothetical protein PSTG_03917 [Puccinia striiformis f. sp. tritici PST-78]
MPKSRIDKPCKRPIQVESNVQRVVYADPKTGLTYKAPYKTVPLSAPGTPSDRGIMEAEEDVAAPWVNGEEPSKTRDGRPRQRNKNPEDESALAEEQRMQRNQCEAELREFSEHKESFTVPIPKRKIRVIIQSSPEIVDNLMAAQRIETNLEDLSGGFLREGDQGELKGKETGEE